MKHRIAAFFFALAFVLASPGAIRAAELSGTPEELRGYLQSETRTVTIHNEATEVAYSDVAKVTLIVSTKRKTLAAAMQDNNELRESIVGELTDSDIELDDIRRSKYSASPQFGWFGSTPNSFEIVNSLVVTVESEAAFRRVAEISDEDDAIRFAGAEFEHSEKDAYENKVRDKALQAVLDDRSFFEERLGLKLHPVSFTFSDVSSSEHDRFGLLEEVVVTARRAPSAGISAQPTAPSSFDEIKYRVGVSVTFEVERQE